MSSATEAFLERPVRPWTLGAAVWLNLALLALTFVAGMITLLESAVRQRGTFFGDDPAMSLPPTGLTAPGIIGASVLLLLLIFLLVVAQGWARVLYVVVCLGGAVFLDRSGLVLPPAIFVLLPGLALSLALLFLPVSNTWFGRP